MTTEDEPRSQITNARELAVNILTRVFYRGAYANLILEKELARTELGVGDRALVTELVNGSVRMKKHLEWVLDLFLTPRSRKLKPEIKTILLASIYQILFLERVPAYAAVNEAVKMASRQNKGAAGLVNAVLRHVERDKDKIEFPDAAREPVKYLSNYYSHPEWMVKRWLNRYGFDQTVALLKFNNQAPSPCIRGNRLKGSLDQILARLGEEGVEAHRGKLAEDSIVIESQPGPFTSLPAYRDGLFYIQGESTMLMAPALSPAPGELVYDFCCGVGGKATHLAEIMQNRGKVLAFDLYPHKLKLLRQNCHRLGIDIIETREGSITDMELPSEEADAVLIDVPCSGLGVLRSRADLRWRRREEDLKELAALQKRLLNRVAASVQPGGRLLYAACTLEPEETVQVIDEFLAQHKDYQSLDLTELLKGFPYSPADRSRAAHGRLGIFPPEYQTEGMFMAVMRRAEH